jgi:hypothetical protein
MNDPDLPSQGAYRHRFGSMSNAFALAGYVTGKLEATETRRSRRGLREQLIRPILIDVKSSDFAVS